MTNYEINTPATIETDTRALKPEIIWTPDLKVTAENWDDLKEQGWLSRRTEFGAGPVALGQEGTGGAQRGLGNLLFGNVYDEIEQRPLTDEEMRSAYSEPGPKPRGTYYRDSLMDLALEVTRSACERRARLWASATDAHRKQLQAQLRICKLGDYQPDIVARTGTSALTGYTFTQEFDIAAIRNPYQGRRLREALEAGIYDGWLVSYFEETARRSDEWTIHQATRAMEQRRT